MTTLPSGVTRQFQFPYRCKLIEISGTRKRDTTLPMTTSLYFVVDQRSCGCSYETIQEPLGLYPTLEQAQASIQETVDEAALKRWCTEHTPGRFPASSNPNVPSIYQVELGKRWNLEDPGHYMPPPPTKWTAEAWKAHPDYEKHEEQKAQWRIQQAESDRLERERQQAAQIKRAADRLAYVTDCQSRGVEPFPGAAASRRARGVMRGRGRGRGRGHAQ
jgi:hypothetical protein